MTGRDNPKSWTRSRIYQLLAGVKERVPKIKAEDIDAKDGTIGGDPILSGPEGSEDVGLSLGGGWTVVDQDSPVLLEASLRAQTDGQSEAEVRIQVDESGGNSADKEVLRAYVDDSLPAGTDVVAYSTSYLPAGASVRVINQTDPNNTNSLENDAIYRI